MANEEPFPRVLTAQEKDLLLWVLPPDRPGYQEYRSVVSTWNVAARGRRGDGNFILTPGETDVDNESPLPQIFAYGIVKTREGDIAVSLRERIGDQIEFEIVNLHGESVPQVLLETGRWTFSSWLPKQPCPICLDGLREVELQSTKGRRFVIAICRTDERIWLYDGMVGVNHPIPLTNFYNELMLHTNIRDPKIALNAKRLFTDLRDYSDADLTKAFVSYNNLRTKVFLEDALQMPSGKKPSFLRRLRSRIVKS